MADTIITPSTMPLNSYIKPTTAGPYAWFEPTTGVTYGVSLPEEGKVALFAMYLAASSVGSVRLKITPPSSTDGAWGYGVGMGSTIPSTITSTNLTLYMGPDAISGSSYSFMFFGPFESARYGSLSTAGTGRLLRCVFDASTGASGNAILSSYSTTLATVATTIKVFAFRMP